MIGQSLTQTSAATGAAEILAKAEQAVARWPGASMVLFRCERTCFLGGIARPYPEKPYIALVSRDTEPLQRSTAAEVRRLRSLPTIRVHPRIEFGARSYLLGLSNDSLCLLSGEDVLYCLVHPRGGVDATVRTGGELIGFDPH